MPEGFKSDRFRFIARTITASDEAPTESATGEIRIKPNLYILVWEPSFFEELLTKDYFFLFPPEILKQHTLVFQLYTFFRSRLVRRLTESMLLSEINQNSRVTLNGVVFRWILFENYANYPKVKPLRIFYCESLGLSLNDHIDHG